MDPVTPRSRRAVLAGALGGVAAAAASSLIRPSTVGATDHSALIVGESNTATLQTTLNSSAGSGTTFLAVASGSGTAIQGTGLTGKGVTGSTTSGVALRGVAAGGYGAYATSTTGIGVIGIAGSVNPSTSFGSVGVVGFRSNGTGVWASSSTGTALKATSGGQGADISSSSGTLPSLVSKATGGTVGVVGLGGNFTPAQAYPDGVGVLGENPDAAGVGMWGRSSNGTGILGESDTGYGMEAYGAVGIYASGGSVGVLGDVDNATGVQGWSGVVVAPDSGVNVGVWAGAENGRTALQTQGVVKMNRSGETTVAVGTSSRKVTVPGGITAASMGFATIQANRSGFYIRGVVLGTADSSITIHLNANATTSAIPVAWVVLG